MLFANRKLTGNAESEIRQYISKECDIPQESIYLCGLEQLDLWLKHFPNVPALAKLDPVDSPLIVSPDDLAEVVQALAKHKESVSNVIDNPPTPRVSHDKKNINDMSKEYAKAQIYPFEQIRITPYSLTRKSFFVSTMKTIKVAYSK